MPRVLVLGGLETLWIVYVLAILSSTALVFDAPGRHALTFQMVGREELPNAVALNARREPGSGRADGSWSVASRATYFESSAVTS